MDKDQSLDKLLRQTMPAGETPGVAGPCLDAETLAAWMADSLPPAGRASAEVHLASCERCLAVIAAIVTTEPPPSLATRSGWFSFRWLVPAATAAVGVAAWLMVQQPQRSAPSAAPSATAADSVKPAMGGDAFKAVPPSERDRKAAEQTSVDARDAAPARPALERQKEQLQARAADESLRKDTERSAAKATVPAPAATPAAPPPSRAEAAKNRGFAATAQKKKDESSVVRSPDGASEWRIDGPAVERSVDGGRTWRAQATGTTVELLAGASPASSICWIVGRNGTVLLTTDGASWRLVPFPDGAGDLVAVSAPNAAEATVTTANGRVYRTADGGKNWTLQENPAAPF